MVSFGFAEILVLAVLGGGINSTDLVALVPPTHYFQTRNIDTSFAKMIELAGRDPKDPKTQVQQLVALRHLADEAEKFKKDANYAAHRAVLEQIASGKKGADKSAFAQDFAQKVLAKIDGTKPMAPKLKPVREDALSWFPPDLTFAVAGDTRQANVSPNDPLKDLIKLMPEHAKKEIYEFVEKSGNIRIERGAIGVADNPGNRDDMKIYIRVTGKGTQAWLVPAIKELARGQLTDKTSKDDKGTPMTFLQDGDRPPIIMIVGDTDVVIYGYGGNNKKSEDLTQGVLDARSGKKANAASGPLKDSLAKVPDKAVAFAVGGIPSEMKRAFQEFGAVPEKILAYAERTQTGMDLQLHASMANADDTKAFVQKASELRMRGIMGLQQAMKQPLPPGSPPVPFQAIMNVLESLQVQGQNGEVQVRTVVSDGLIQQLGTMGMMYFGASTKPPLKE
jgi:hypothetical protein